MPVVTFTAWNAQRKSDDSENKFTQERYEEFAKQIQADGADLVFVSEVYAGLELEAYGYKEEARVHTLSSSGGETGLNLKVFRRKDAGHFTVLGGGEQAMTGQKRSSLNLRIESGGRQMRFRFVHLNASYKSRFGLKSLLKSAGGRRDIVIGDMNSQMTSKTTYTMINQQPGIQAFQPQGANQTLLQETQVGGGLLDFFFASRGLDVALREVKSNTYTAVTADAKARVAAKTTPMELRDVSPHETRISDHLKVSGQVTLRPPPIILKARDRRRVEALTRKYELGHREVLQLAHHLAAITASREARMRARNLARQRAALPARRSQPHPTGQMITRSWGYRGTHLPYSPPGK